MKGLSSAAMSSSESAGPKASADTTRFVRAAVTGDAAATAWLVTRFSPLLRRQAAHRLGRLADDSAVDDLVQDVWLWALPRLGRVRPHDGRYTPSLLAYLGARARGAANDHLERLLKRRTREEELPEDSRVVASHANPLAAEVRDALASASARELRERLDRALDQLDEPSRTVLLLRGVEGLTNAEAAEELGERQNTTAQRYRRALAKLRELLPLSVLDELTDD